jgi:hypothetical protein
MTAVSFDAGGGEAEPVDRQVAADREGAVCRIVHRADRPWM